MANLAGVKLAEKRLCLSKLFRELADAAERPDPPDGVNTDPSLAYLSAFWLRPETAIIECREAMAIQSTSATGLHPHLRYSKASARNVVGCRTAATDPSEYLGMITRRELRKSMPDRLTPSDTIQLRPSRPEDADAILAFIRAMGFTPRDRITWDALGMSAAIAVRGREIVGAIPIEMRPVKIGPDLTVQWAHQTCVAVHPDLRGGGLGSRLQKLLRSTLPSGTAMMGVYREDPDSPAYQWYLNNGFRRAMTVVSWTLEVIPLKDTPSPVPSPPYPGERARVRGSEPFEGQSEMDSDRSLPLTFSPDCRGEGTRCADLWGHTRSNGCFVDQSQRSLLKWLDVHPYRSRYRFDIIETENAYAVLGVGSLHSDSPRADMLDFIGDESAAEQLLDRCIERAKELGASPLRWVMAEHDPNVTLARVRGMSPGWTFDLLIQEIAPGLHFDVSSWRYASIDFV